jgi:predicted RNase H-like nuclease
VLEVVEHAAANALARRVSGRGLSLQSFHLLPKIRAVDVWMHSAGSTAERTAECHPELAFARLGGAPMDEPKRTAAGRAARLRLLELLVPGALDAAEELLARHRRSELAHDDVADALALAVVAALPDLALESLGEVDGAIPVDAAGLAMRILAPRVDWRARLVLGAARATRPAR